MLTVISECCSILVTSIQYLHLTSREVEVRYLLVFHGAARKR